MSFEIQIALNWTILRMVDIQQVFVKCGRQSISSGHRVGASDIFVQYSGVFLISLYFIMTECK